jgi:hypothetical protein
MDWPEGERHKFITLTELLKGRVEFGSPYQVGMPRQDLRVFRPRQGKTPLA